MTPEPLSILCVASYFKGEEFMRACKRQGCRVYLLTAEKLSDAAWPREYLDDIFFFPGNEEEWKENELVKGVSYLARTHIFNRIVPLDDFDLEKGAFLREHLRVPGMGDTRTRYFRDKLAMRMQAREYGIAVPDFEHVLNDSRIKDFTDRCAAPWVIKPRSSASAAGIKIIHSVSELTETRNQLGDEQSFYLLEQFIPGDIFHVDSIVFGSKVVFARAHQYTAPPLEVAHEGGIFATRNVLYDSPDEVSLLRMNDNVIGAMGLQAGVSHTEFIKSTDGTFYFLETSARVGGAHIAEMLEASSGINLWAEWAQIECLPKGNSYQPPKARRDFSGVIISLARQNNPDTSAYDDPEIVWRMHKPNHVGLIVQSPSQERIMELLHSYTKRFIDDFFAFVPAKDRPID